MLLQVAMCAVSDWTQCAVRSARADQQREHVFDVATGKTGTAETGQNVTIG